MRLQMLIATCIALGIICNVSLSLSLSLSSLSLSPPPLSPLLYITGIYTCPCYYYPNRSGKSGWPSFVVAVDLRSGASSADHWIKRGTALLMSLDN